MVLFSSYTTNSERLSGFIAVKSIVFQIKVFGRKVKKLH